MESANQGEWAVTGHRGQTQVTHHHSGQGGEIQGRESRKALLEDQNVTLTSSRKEGVQEGVTNMSAMQTGHV